MNELSLMAYMIQNPERYRSCRRYLERFQPSSLLLRYCWEVLRESFNTQQRFPTAEEATWLLQSRVPPSAGTEFCQALPILSTQLYHSVFTDVTGDMLGKIVVEMERERFQSQLQTVTSLKDLENFESGFREMKEALTTQERTWITPFAIPELVANPLGFIQEFWGDPIPLGMPGFDAWLQGGVRRGELVEVIGLTGGGKSLLMLWWCLSMAMRGYRTFYFSFDNVIGELLTRALCAVSGIQIDAEVTEEQYARKLAIALEQFPGLKENFHIQKWPRGRHTIKDIERVLDQHEQRFGAPVDVGFADYLNCIRPEGNYRDQKRFALDEVASDLAATAEERNMVWFSPLQSNKIGKWQDTLDIDNAAEAWSMVWHASIAMSVTATKIEKHLGQARILLGKARRRYLDYIVPVMLDPGSMRCWENPERQIQFRAQIEMLEAETGSGKKQKGVKGLPPAQEFVAPIVRSV